MAITWPRSIRTRTTLLIASSLALIAAIGTWWLFVRTASPTPPPLTKVEDGSTDSATESSAESPATIEFPRESWEAAGIAIQPVTRAPLSQSVDLTGKITLNEDRVAHIYPLVEGRVDEVKIRFGQKVKRGDLLVVVQSKEVGQAMLQLYQDRLLRDFAVTKDRWIQTVTENTQSLIDLIRKNAEIETIEQALHDRPLGEYRDKLVTAYIAHYKARKDLDRLTPLSEEGAVTGKQLLQAEAEWNAARATLQAFIEQIQQDTKQASIVSTQSVKELQTRVSVDETNLKIIGFDDDALAEVDPLQQGEAIAHYPVLSPFDGTIISKDVVLLERVGPESQILSIADLSTVWVSADIYEEHLHLLEQLDRQVVHLRSNAWPGKVFEARIFYTGDVVHESTRTISLRAVADNAAGYLKPGMFVNVEFPGIVSDDVVQLPLAAVHEHAGATFVFVHLNGDAFSRRDVVLGRRNDQAVEIISGLEPGELAVIGGGFALKSRMLADLLSD